MLGSEVSACSRLMYLVFLLSLYLICGIVYSPVSFYFYTTMYVSLIGGKPPTKINDKLPFNLKMKSTEVQTLGELRMRDTAN